VRGHLLVGVLVFACVYSAEAWESHMVPLAELSGNGVHMFSDEERGRYTDHVQQLQDQRADGDLGDEQDDSQDSTVADAVLNMPPALELGQDENATPPMRDADITAGKAARGALDLAKKVQKVLANMETVQQGTAASEMETSMHHLHIALQESEIEGDLERTKNAAKFVKERVDDDNIGIGARGIERAQKTHNWEDHKPKRLTDVAEHVSDLSQRLSKRMARVRTAIVKTHSDFVTHQKELGSFGLGEAQDSDAQPWLEEDRQHLVESVKHLHHIAEHLRRAVNKGEAIH